MDQNILTESDFNLILQKYRPHDENIEYVSSKCIPLSGSVEGFMGEYFTLQINYKLNNKDETLACFVKCMPTHKEYQQTLAKERNLYGKEIFFLNFLLKEYEKYNLDCNFAPRCYYSKNDQILVMENLVSNQYKLSEKNKLYTLEQCKVGLKALAAYHGSSFLYEELKSQELGEIYRFDRQFPEIFKENYYDLTLEKQFARLIVGKTINGIKFIINDLDDNFEYKDEFEKNLTVENLLKCFTTKTELRKATGHGDLWYNNIFFKYEDDVVTKCAIVDYQVMRYFYPAFDVLIFIHLNTSKEFRKLHLPHLLKYYYDSLSDVLLKRDFDIKDVLPLEDFNASLKLVECNALFTVTAMGTLVFMSEETLQDLYKGMDQDATDAFQYHYELFCREFISDQNYRKKLSDAVHDLYDSCTKNLYLNNLL